MFQLYFSTSNAAFDDEYPNEEIALVVRSVAKKITDGDLDGVILDGNGNRIGEFSVTD